MLFMALGNRAVLSGLNIVGLKRQGFDREQIHSLRKAYRLLFSAEGTLMERMMAIFFLAIMLDRLALTLRNVAIAALIILLTLPESVLNVSFQMSFAAVVGLVSVYETATSRRRNALDAGILGNGMARAWRYFAGIGLTTLVASLATAPFAAFHFHKLAQFSLLGNLAAMPLVGILIMVFDSNFSGRSDFILLDNDKDGKWDQSLHDTDEDGKYDLIGHHPDGKMRPTRYTQYKQ